MTASEGAQPRKKLSARFFGPTVNYTGIGGALKAALEADASSIPKTEYVLPLPYRPYHPQVAQAQAPPGKPSETTPQRAEAPVDGPDPIIHNRMASGHSSVLVIHEAPTFVKTPARHVDTPARLDYPRAVLEEPFLDRVQIAARIQNFPTPPCKSDEAWKVWDHRRKALHDLALAHGYLFGAVIDTNHDALGWRARVLARYGDMMFMHMVGGPFARVRHPKPAIGTRVLVTRGYAKAEEERGQGTLHAFSPVPQWFFE